MRRFFLFLITLCLAMNTAARTDEAPVLDVEDTYDAIGTQLYYLAENDHELSLDEARSAFAVGQFSRSESPVPTFGIGTSPVWLRIVVDNPGTHAVLRRLVLENSWLDMATVYFIQNGKTESITAGDLLPFSARKIKHRFHVFDHEYRPGTTEIYIRAQTADPMVLPIFFGDIAASNKRDTLNGYSYGLLYGIIIGLTLYNLFLFLSIRQRRYFYYVIYLSSFLVMNFSYTGHGYELIWSNSVWLQQWINPISISLLATTGIMFAFSFLKIRELSPALFIGTACFIIAFWLVQLGFILSDLQTLSVIIAIAFVTVFSIFTFYCAIKAYAHGHRDAIYYLIATIATLIGALVTALAVSSFVPYSTLTYRAAEIAVSIDAILLSIALAEQFRRIQKEKNEALQLARIDMLTNLKNRRAFEEVSHPIWHNAVRHQHETSVIMLDLDNFKQINDNYGHASGDAVLKEIAAVLNTLVREGDVLARWGGEEFIILLPQTSLYDAARIAERIRVTISELTIKTRMYQISTTASLGVAQNSETISDLEELIRLADKGLYQAKQCGRNSVCAN